MLSLTVATTTGESTRINDFNNIYNTQKREQDQAQYAIVALGLQRSEKSKWELRSKAAATTPTTTTRGQNLARRAKVTPELIKLHGWS